MFKIDGINVADLRAVADVEDFKQKAAMRYEEIAIDGRPGSVFNELGRSNVVKSFKLTLLEDTYLDDILALFDGKRMLEYDGRVTDVYFYETLETANMKSLKEITVSYIRGPFWYKASDQFYTVVNSVTNGGNTIAYPIIELSGTGEVDITINNTRFIYTFDEDEKVLIDCYEQTETYEGISKAKNMQIGFEYPHLNVGSNSVMIHSGTPTIKIKRKDAWL